jgi:undecaprenyl-diphosphatase
VTVGQAFLLGLVQGVTEFLPISSSGHLVIMQQWFGFTESLLTFDVFLHLGTLIAIIIFFGRGLFKISLREWLMVAIGTVPAVIVGLLFKDQIEAMFMASTFIGLELIITGLVNFYIDHKVKNPAPERELAPSNSFMIGIAQAVAIVPAISRSGSTVAAAMATGINRETAFKYSFLLAIPALAGAGILELKDVMAAGELGQIDYLTFGIGGVTALLSGLASLGLFRYVINHAQLKWFGWYCIVLGSGLLLNSWL